MPGEIAGNDKARLLISSDIFVFPTCYPYEGHPFVILEAMAAGLPVISTDQGAIRETVLDGLTGFIVPHSDPRAIAEKILLLLRDSDLRRRMGSASRDRFLRHFTLERWGTDMYQLFGKVLSER
jgi:glycosyltransferase involved in cell wall biosynthesis